MWKTCTWTRERTMRAHVRIASSPDRGSQSTPWDQNCDCKAALATPIDDSWVPKLTYLMQLWPHPPMASMPAVAAAKRLGRSTVAARTTVDDALVRRLSAQPPVSSAMTKTFPLPNRLPEPKYAKPHCPNSIVSSITYSTVQHGLPHFEPLLQFEFAPSSPAALSLGTVERQHASCLVMHSVQGPAASRLLSVSDSHRPSWHQLLCRACFHISLPQLSLPAHAVSLTPLDSSPPGSGLRFFAAESALSSCRASG